MIHLPFLMDLFPSWFGHLKNIGFLSYADLLNVNPLFNVKKRMFINITIPLIKESFQVYYWVTVKLTVADTNFPKIKFLLEYLNFILTNIVNCFSWNIRSTLLIFEKLSAKCPSLTMACSSVVLSSENDVPWIKLLI